MKTLFRPLRQGLLLALTVSFVAPVFAQARKVDPQDLYRYWILLNTKVQMDAPNSGLNLDKPGCVAVTYTVGSDGVPFNVQVAKIEPNSDLGPMARSAVANFRYGPSLTNKIGQPMASYYIVPFNAPKDPAQRQKLMEPCKLPGYTP
ncbi:MAG: energy transducer TonB [Rhodanobacter sp.]